MAPRLKDIYEQKVVPALVEKFGYKNRMAVPKLSKIVVNMGVGRATDTKGLLESAAADMAVIAGQKAQITRARKSVSQFKVRQGNPVGCRVTLRRSRMFEFLDRLTHTALPRVRDFRGLPSKSFDGHGNYSFGLREQTVFPEINVDKVEHVQGMHVTIVTTSGSDEEAHEMLRLLGFPFATAGASA